MKARAYVLDGVFYIRCPVSGAFGASDNLEEAYFLMLDNKREAMMRKHEAGERLKRDSEAFIAGILAEGEKTQRAVFMLDIVRFFIVGALIGYYLWPKGDK